MPLHTALEAYKSQNFAAARDMIAGMDSTSYAEMHFLIKGLSELALQDSEAALATFTTATEKFPTYAPFWLSRGNAEENLGQIDAAIASMEHCLIVNPSQAEAFGNLSNLYCKKKRFVEAETMARQALAHGAPAGEALNCLGIALGKQRRFDEAEAAWLDALKHAPNHSDILANLANQAVDLLQFDKAWPLFAAARAIIDKPVYRRDEGMGRLMAGDYAKGWALFEARLEMPNALRLIPTCPIWRGEKLAGKKLLILAEQGFGDVIQFCRYQEFLPDAELIWAVPKPLVRLMSGAVRGHVFFENDPLPKCDAYVPIMSLPLLTGQTAPHKWQGAARFSARLREEGVPYDIQQGFLKDLAADIANDNQSMGAPIVAPFTPAIVPPMPPLRLPLLPEGTHALRIGIVWAGSPTHIRDHERSIPLEVLAPALTKINADFYAPFIGAALNEIGTLPIQRLDNLITDFADTAALLNQMDCLITVDTSVAHLAGTLGLKTFLLLHHCPDWRWETSASTTAWYPSLTLLRQSRFGDWSSVVSRLTKLLSPASDL